jgi:hypothetical protein
MVISPLLDGMVSSMIFDEVLQGGTISDSVTVRISLVCQATHISTVKRRFDSSNVDFFHRHHCIKCPFGG